MHYTHTHTHTHTCMEGCLPSPFLKITTDSCWFSLCQNEVCFALIACFSFIILLESCQWNSSVYFFLEIQSLTHEIIIKIPTLLKSNAPSYVRDFPGGKATGKFSDGKI